VEIRQGYTLVNVVRLCRPIAAKAIGRGIPDPSRMTTKEKKLMRFLKNFPFEEDGQDMVEYGIIVAALVVGGLTVFAAFTGQLTSALSALGTAVGNAF
jgi:Flp pilus assembly pilin Flp